MTWIVFELVCNDIIIPSMLVHSYLADQCWNGGCIYLIMLRRVKRKAPLPPCDVNGGVLISSDGSEEQQHQQQVGAAPHPPDQSENCKRTRKFGVISRSSFNRDTRDSTDSELQSCYNGYSSSVPTETELSPGEDPGYILSSHTPAEETPHTFLQVRAAPQHLHSGGTATLPARCHSQLIECKMDSVSSEPSNQVRRGGIYCAGAEDAFFGWFE